MPKMLLIICQASTSAIAILSFSTTNLTNNTNNIICSRQGCHLDSMTPGLFHGKQKDNRTKIILFSGWSNLNYFAIPSAFLHIKVLLSFSQIKCLLFISFLFRLSKNWTRKRRDRNWRKWKKNMESTRTSDTKGEHQKMSYL